MIRISRSVQFYYCLHSGVPSWIPNLMHCESALTFRVGNLSSGGVPQHNFNWEHGISD